MGEWTGKAEGECPAVQELRKALLDAVPLLKAHPQKILTIRQDGSRHTAGLAMDIMLNSRNRLEKMIADDIIAALVKEHPQMQWSDLIYTDWKGGKPSYFHIPGMPPYGGPKGMLKKNTTASALGTKHENHIHIDWWGFNSKEWPDAASNTGFKTSLVGEIRLRMAILGALEHRSDL